MTPQWTHLTTDEQEELADKTKLYHRELEDLDDMGEMKLFSTVNDFWEWFADENNGLSLFWTLLENGDKGALQHGTIKNYMFRQTGAYALKTGSVVFIYGHSGE